MASLALLAPASAHGAIGDEQAINYEPTFLFVDGSPGESVTATIQVRNQTRSDASFTAALADLAESPGSSTAFDFVEPGEARRGAGEWMTADPEEFELAAGTERRVSIRIEIPDDAGAGGHFGAVVFSVEPAVDVGQFDVAYTTGIPVLVTVDGAFERDLRVRVRADERWMFSGGRAGWTVELRNEGDVHEVISGRLRMDSVLSGSTSVALRPGILLPGERRAEHVRVDVRSAPDIHRAHVRVKHDGAADVTATSPRMFVFPIWVLVVLFVAIAIVWVRIRTGGRRPMLDDELDDEFRPAG